MSVVDAHLKELPVTKFSVCDNEGQKVFFIINRLPFIITIIVIVIVIICLSMVQIILRKREFKTGREGCCKSSVMKLQYEKLRYKVITYYENMLVRRSWIIFLANMKINVSLWSFRRRGNFTFGDWLHL